MKACRLCGVEQPYENFHKGDGIGGHRARCRSCESTARSARYWRNPEKSAAYAKQYVAEHADKRRAYGAKWRANNRALQSEMARVSRAKKPEHYAAYGRAYRQRNRDAWLARMRGNNAERAAKKMRALPKWANHFFMSEAYHLAALRSRLLGVPHEVDHIVPLRSSLVCGLHCESNLRVITKAANMDKGNRWWPDC